jgi:predicted CopG family antitoxin
MAKEQTEVTTIGVQKDTHRELKEAKPEGETWSRFLQRAVESLDSDKAFTDGQEERLNELIREEFEEEYEDIVNEALDDFLAR